MSMVYQIRGGNCYLVDKLPLDDKDGDDRAELLATLISSNEKHAERLMLSPTKVLKAISQKLEEEEIGKQIKEMKAK
jgi:hypothetical protein